MSLILEALKKSEAERRLGHLPDLMTPSGDAATGMGRAWLPGFLLGLAVALLVAAGLAGWWWAVRNGVADESAPAEAVNAAPVAPAPAADRSRHPPGQDIVESTRSPASAPRRAPPAAVTPAQVITQVPTREDPEFAGIERESVPLPAGSIPLPPPAPTPPAPRPAAPAPVQTPAAPAPSTATPASVPGSTAPAPAEPLEAVPLLSMLMPAQREGLPPLRLSMHVYDADPAGRFVLIDGRRYRQGDAIEKGLVVETIRPDGALIVRGGLRFLVPRP